MVFGIIRVIAVVLFMYLSWRNLRENYKEETLVPFLWGAVLVFLIAGRISFGLVNWGVWNDNVWNWFLVWQKPGFEYIGATLAMFGIMSVMAKRNQWKVNALLENVTWEALLMMAIFMADEFIRGRFDLSYGLALVVMVLGLVISIRIKKKYRSFVWYLSGKVGFVFYFTAAAVFIMLAGVSILLKQAWFVSSLYLLLGLLSISGLFILGEMLNPLLVKFKRKK